MLFTILILLVSTPLVLLLMFFLLLRLFSCLYGPLHILLDLDRTLIKSELLNKDELIASLPRSVYTGSFDQIDDDFDFEPDTPNTRTWFRPYARFFMFWCQYVLGAHIYVFTSAQETYTDNVRNAMREKGYDIKYVTRWLTRDDFPKNRFLRTHGKDIQFMFFTNDTIENEILPHPDITRSELDELPTSQPLEVVLKRAVLVDDINRYLSARADNGVLIVPWKNVKEQWGDRNLLKLGLILLYCHFFKDIRSSLRKLKHHVEEIKTE